MSAFIDMTLVLALQIFFGNSGVFSFGHSAFMAIGAYISGLLTVPVALKLTLVPDAPSIIRDHQTGFAAAIAIAIALTGLIAFMFGVPILDSPRIAIGISTLGILLITNAVLLAATQLTRGARPFYGVPQHSTPAWIVGAAVVAILIARLFRESPWGLEFGKPRRRVGGDCDGRQRLSAPTGRLDSERHAHRARRRPLRQLPHRLFAQPVLLLNHLPDRRNADRRRLDHCYRSRRRHHPR